MSQTLTFDNNHKTVESWLKSRIGQELKMSEESIDSTAEFASFSLDSIVWVTFANDLGDWIGRDIDPTIFWEYESITELSRWIIEYVKVE